MPHDELLLIVNQVRDHKHQEPIVAYDPDMRIREDLGFSSLDLAELTVRIEEKFGVDVFADGLVGTVGEILAKIISNKR